MQSQEKIRNWNSSCLAHSIWLEQTSAAQGSERRIVSTQRKSFASKKKATTGYGQRKKTDSSKNDSIDGAWLERKKIDQVDGDEQKETRKKKSKQDEQSNSDTTIVIQKEEEEERRGRSQCVANDAVISEMNTLGDEILINRS